MRTILMLKGLQASGKSTFAKELARDPEWKRINKDELRRMLHGGKFNSQNEKYVLKVRDELCRQALFAGFNVVIDDTNLSPQHEKRLRTIAENHEVNFEVKYFDVSLWECLWRNSRRALSEQVPIEGILNTWEKYIKDEDTAKVSYSEAQTYIQNRNFQEFCTVRHNKSMPTAILCDIDGTLAHMVGRSPYDGSRVDEDKLDETIARLLDRLNDKYKIILMSGRESSCRYATEEWLKKHNIYYDHLFMRPEVDGRKDSVVKEELFKMFVEPNYNVEFVLDDRNQVVEMWRSLGLKTLQVADGNF